MSQEQPPLVARFPREIFRQIIAQSVMSLSIKDSLTLRGVCNPAFVSAIANDPNAPPSTSTRLWKPLWCMESTDETLRTLLAVHAVKHADVIGLSRVLARCTKGDTFYSGRFGIDVFNIALKSGNTEVAKELLPFVTPQIFPTVYPDDGERLTLQRRHELRWDTFILAVWFMFADAASEQDGRFTLRNALQNAASSNRADKYDCKEVLTGAFNSAVISGSANSATCIISSDGFDVNLSRSRVVSWRFNYDLVFEDTRYGTPLGKVLRSSKTRWGGEGERLQVIKVLLDHVASPNLTKYQLSPFSVALNDNDLQVISLLLDHGAGIFPNTPLAPPKDNEQIKLVLYAAIVFGYSAIVKILVDSSVDPTFHIDTANDAPRPRPSAILASITETLFPTPPVNFRFRVELLPAGTPTSLFDIWAVGQFLDHTVSDATGLCYAWLDLNVTNLHRSPKEALWRLSLAKGFKDHYGLSQSLDPD
ncbi:hypothetical protein BDW74DRAFT_181189 [Aspergillus multicolor]|uniref:uncharacterized protein n=1 Tax=Aspergillus multicolor TaxID=41759 RepID=UPI003CCDE12C